MNRKNGSSDKKRIGILLRVSTKEQAEGGSPEHHEARARQYAALKGWEVVELYDLLGFSGKTVIGHPEIKRMLRDIQRGHIDGLIFSKLERLARNTRELLEFADFFQSHNATLISLAESIDTDSPIGRCFYTLVAALAQLGREEIEERVKASVPIRAQMGKHMGGKAPFGYQWNADKKLVPDPATAPIRKLIHELYLKHGRKNAVATALNKAGHRTQNGKPFTAAGIRIMLHDSTPKGLHRANYMSSSRVKGKRMKSEEHWVYHPVEPIMPAELWDSCYQILVQQEAGEKPRARTPLHPFAGITFCGKCGSKMYVPSNNPKYVCRNKGCRHKITCTDLEAAFINAIRDYFISPEEMQRYMVEANTELGEKEALLGSLERERDKLRQEMERFCRLIKEDAISIEGFKENYRPMEERYAQLSTEIPRLEGDLDYMKVNLMAGDEVFKTGQNVTDLWPKLDQVERQRVAELLVEQIIVHHDTLEILTYHPLDNLQRCLAQGDGPDGPGDYHLTPVAEFQSPSKSGSPYPSIASALSEDMATSKTTLTGA